MLTGTHFAPRHMAEAYRASRDWTVIVRWPEALPHQPRETLYRFADEGQARMFAHSCGSVVEVRVRGVGQ